VGGLKQTRLQKPAGFEWKPVVADLEHVSLPVAPHAIASAVLQKTDAWEGESRDENGRNFSRIVPFCFLYFLVRFRICEIPFSYLRK
jgi:hypothetical protein